jgi:hypothetical protein
MPPPPWPGGNPDTLTGGGFEVAAAAVATGEPPQLPAATVRPTATPTMTTAAATTVTRRLYVCHGRFSPSAFDEGFHRGMFMLLTVPAENYTAMRKPW